MVQHLLTKKDRKEHKEKKCREKVGAEAETDIKPLDEIIGSTTTLIVDCNNVMYADKHLMKKHKYKMSHKKAINSILKVVIMWANLAESRLTRVVLVWDLFDFQKFGSKPLRPKVKKHEIKRQLQTLKEQIHLNSQSTLVNSVNFSHLLGDKPINV